MAGVMPTTNSEAMMKILQQIASAMAAPDANLDELAKLQEQVVKSIRTPYDTPSPGTPVGAAMDVSAGAAAPPAGAPAPGELSPMLAALMGGAGAGAGAPAGPPPPAAGTFPMGAGVMAGAAPPNMDEVRRMISSPGSGT